MKNSRIFGTETAGIRHCALLVSRQFWTVQVKVRSIRSDILLREIKRSGVHSYLCTDGQLQVLLWQLRAVVTAAETTRSGSWGGRR